MPPSRESIIQLRSIVLAAVATVVAGIAIGSIGPRRIAAWLSPAPASAPRPIVFDNASVRDLPASEPAPPVRPRAAQAAPGQLRKCLQADGSVVYSNLACPTGAREAKVRSDGVNVLPSGLPARSTDAQPAATPGGLRPLQPGETLQQRAIERAIDGATSGPP